MLFLAVVMDFVLLADIAVVFLFPLKNNRHGTFLAGLKCRRDIELDRVYLDDTVVTVGSVSPQDFSSCFHLVANTTLTRQLRPKQTRKHCCGNIVSCQCFAMFPRVGTR